MIPTPAVKLLIAALLSIGTIPVESAANGLRASRNATSILCHVTMECVSTGDSVGQIHQQHHHYECSPVENGFVSDYSYVVDLPSDFIDQHKADLTGGKLFANIPGGEIVNGAVIVPKDSIVTVGTAPKSFETRHRKLSTSVGTRSVLVLRISSNDASPGFSAQQFYNYIFPNTGFTQPTLTSQYKRMSFGKLNIVPTKYGVMEVKVNSNSNGASSAAIRDAAISAVTSKYGLSSITQLADHVMFCIPPGTGNWAGSSPITSWRLVLNNQWCGYVSGLVHEMGHNLGLLHSNIAANAYMDYTSYMSAGYATSFYPAKSFNAANNWQFGWYSDRQVTVNPSQGGKVVTLASFVDYGKSNKNNPVIIKVGSRTFLQYNTAKDFNYQTQEMQNQVVAVEQLGSGTNRLGGVDLSNRQITISNFDGSGRNVVIYACGRGSGSSSDPDWMSISIGYDRNYCNQAKMLVSEVTDVAGQPTSAPIRSNVVAQAVRSRPTQAPVILPSTSTVSQQATEGAICQDNSVSQFIVEGHSRTCSWLSPRIVWKQKLCSLQHVQDSCPKTCGKCI